VSNYFSVNLPCA